MSYESSCKKRSFVLNYELYLKRNSTANIGIYLEGFEYEILRINSQHVNMKFLHFATPYGLEKEKGNVYNLITDMFTKGSVYSLRICGK